MNFHEIVRRSRKTVSDHSPIILAGAGIAGTVLTAVFAARGGYKAGYRMALLDEQETKKEVGKERFKAVTKETWKLYLPSAASGVGTITAIAAANRIGTKRAAALAAAYTVADKAFAEYKEKVTSTIGEKKEQAVRDAVAQDKTNATAAQQDSIVFMENDTQVLMLDAYSGRYFKSDMESVKKAQNDTNYEVLHNLYVSLNEFYDRVGLERIPLGDEVGWNSDKMMELLFSATVTKEGRPCMVITFDVEPTRWFYKTKV